MTSVNTLGTSILYPGSSVTSMRLVSRERGVSLVVALIFLIILTILGLTAMRVATMEERMSGNSRDRSLAFQAAEAALRDAESDVDCLNYNRIGAAPTKRSTGCLSGVTGANAACTDGLCCNVNGLTCIEPALPVYKNSALSFTAAPSVQYGAYTGAPQIAGLSQQPRYLIEPFMLDGKSYYRITVRGYGLNSDTQVTLQEVYYKE
jgi:type IV pilus assembly protein PilX